MKLNSLYVERANPWKYQSIFAYEGAICEENYRHDTGAQMSQPKSLKQLKAKTK